MQRGKRNTRMSEDVHLAASQGETGNNRARDETILRKESGMKDVIDTVKGDEEQRHGRQDRSKSRERLERELATLKRRLGEGTSGQD
jgi:hypothetical protein